MLLLISLYVSLLLFLQWCALVIVLPFILIEFIKDAKILEHSSNFHYFVVVVVVI